MAPAVLFWTGANAIPNWSDSNNWVAQGSSSHVSPTAGDTLIFSSNPATNPAFANAFSSNNDINNLMLNGIVLDATGGGSFTLTGNGLTVSNTDQTYTAGITNFAPAGTNAINIAGSGIKISGAATIDSDAGTLFVNSNLAIAGGVITYAGAGSIDVNGQMSTVVSGLTEGQVNLANNIGAARLPIDIGLGTTVQSGTTMAQKSGTATTVFANPTSMHVWTSNDTFIYTGTIFFPNDPATPGFGNLSFAGVIDDSFALWIDGITYISRIGWTTPAQSGNIHLSAGPHSFEARFGNGGGGAGADGQNNNGYTGFANTIGFVYRVNKGSHDPLALSTHATDYFQTTPAYTQANGNPAPLGGFPQDPGDGSLFQTNARSGILKTGTGTLTLGASNPFLGPVTLNGGITQIVNDSSLGASTDPAMNNAVPANPVTIGAATLEFMGAAPATGTIVSNFSYVLSDAASTIMVDPGQTVTFNSVIGGAGTLNKTGMGTLVLNTASIYGGGTTVTAGQVIASTRSSLGAGTATLAGGTLSLQGSLSAQQPISLTSSSFNQDVVWARAEADATSGTTATLDNSYVLYETGQPFSYPGSGLPGNGQIVSATTPGVSFQLQRYGSSGGSVNNVNLLSNISATATLTLSTPGQYSALNVLGAGIGATATYNVILVFSDGTSDTSFTGNRVPDWTAATVTPAGTLAGAAVDAIGRVSRAVSLSAPGYITAGGPKLYESDFALPLADQAKTLTEVRIAQTTPGRLAVFALAGTNLGQSPVTYANNIRVTASSTLDATSAAATAVQVGALTMGAGTTLTLAGGGVNQLTFGPTTLNGASAIIPAAGETVTLGSVSNGGGVTTLNVGPAGIVNVPNIPSDVTLIGNGTLGALVAVANGGAINPGAGSGAAGSITIAAGGLTMASGATFNAEIGGVTAGSTYDQVSSGGTITLGSARLNPTLLGGFVPMAGQVFTILRNSGASPIDGFFSYLSPNSNSLITLSEGAKFNLPGNVVDFQISYVGGSGHDVTLSALTPGAAASLQVIPSISTAAAGTPMTFTVIGLDAAGLTAANYNGTVHFTSSDAQVSLPPNAPLTNSVGKFVVALKTAGNQTLTATDGSGTTGTSIGVTVTPVAANHFILIAPALASFGIAFNFTVTAKDRYNNTATSAGIPYTGTIHFSCSDPAAVLPANTTLFPAIGSGVFTATINGFGFFTLIASDTLSSGITGSANISSLVCCAPPANHFDFISVPTTVSAGTPFQVTVAAKLVDDLIATDYIGTVTLTSTGGGLSPPAISGAVNQGVVSFVVTLTSITGGPFTLTAKDYANANMTPATAIIPVIFGPASYFAVTPSAALKTTGVPFSTTVVAKDTFGNVVTNYTGTVKLTSSDPTALTLVPSYTFVAGDNGTHVFSTALNTAGSQTITVTQIPVVNPIVTGSSSAITLRGLVVSSITPTPTGFNIGFSKAFVPASVTMYGSSATTPQDVTLVGGNWGTMSGSLIVNSTNTGFTFKASAIPLDFINEVLNGNSATISPLLNGSGSSIVLPDDVWTITLKSGTTNGFKDALGAPLDGAGNGGTANYTATFTTSYIAGAIKVIGLPDFARGPDNTTTTNIIKVPNAVDAPFTAPAGIPVVFYNATGLNGATFTVNYNPTLINITAGANTDSSGGGTKTFTLTGSSTIDATHAMATFSYTNTVSQSGNVTLGDIIANVPNAARVAYGVKQLITISAITANGTNATALTAPAFAINTYFGDVSGDGSIGAADVNPMFTISTGNATGFNAYVLTDPAIVGDVASDVTVDGGDVAYLKSFILHLPRTKIPQPPTGVGPITSPSLIDPILSLSLDGTNSSALTRNVAVNLDNPHPAGSTGLTEAVLALKFDPAALSITADDIALGDLPGLDAGWRLFVAIDQTNGLIGITLLADAPLTTTQAGSLVHIHFSVKPGVTDTSVDLFDGAWIGGEFYGLTLADGLSGWVVSRGVALQVPGGST